MKIFLKDLSNYNIQKLIVCSIEQALFQAIVVIDNEEHLVWQTATEPVRSRNLMKMRELFECVDVGELILRHESPYDEMIGLEKNEHGNRLEVPLSKDPYLTEKWLKGISKNALFS